MEVLIFKSSYYRFTSLNLTIGRELKLTEKLRLEGHLGLSYLSHHYTYPDYTIGGYGGP